MSFAWPGTRVLVTGGASFIGSHLVDWLLHRGADIRVVDDLSSGKLANLQTHLDGGDVEAVEADLRDPEVAARALHGIDVCFHLAADHGGRGYVDLHQWACSTNAALDSQVFQQALRAGVEKIVFASSGCIYPLSLQTDPGEILYLTEDMAGPPYDPDGLYGMAKLSGELALRALHLEHGVKAASCRYFTVYGPRGVENHAVMAMIARAFIREDPYRVWGTGEQIRNWTYVEDIVEGTILAAERIDDATAVNLGTMERTRVIDAARMILERAGHLVRIETQPDMPTGPYNRVADNSLARRLLGWEPRTPFAEGVAKTMDWYFATKDASEVRATLEAMLTGRGRPAVGAAMAG